MARRPRIEFEGALYHVITRGNQRQRVFGDVEDHERYLKILADYKVRYEYALYAYVLMSNHIHVLIETRETPLSKILQGVNQSYTMYFNRKYGMVGHLFQGRYKAILCDKDGYLLSLVKYIHLNPMRAGIVQEVDKYSWSSHRVYIGRAEWQGGGIVDTEEVLRMFSENKGRARRAYRFYMGESKGIRREEVYATVDQRVLGDERFVKKVVEKAGREELRGRRRHEYTLVEIGGAVETVCGLNLRELREKGRGEEIQRGRRVLSLVGKEYGYRGREMAEYLRRDPSVITRYLRDRKRYKTEVGEVHKNLKNQKQ
ncbi:MAG: transposase [Thermodesulfobacteriota bacterium]